MCNEMHDFCISGQNADLSQSSNTLKEKDGLVHCVITCKALEDLEANTDGKINNTHCQDEVAHHHIPVEDFGIFTQRLQPIMAEPKLLQPNSVNSLSLYFPTPPVWLRGSNDKKVK